MKKRTLTAFILSIPGAMAATLDEIQFLYNFRFYFLTAAIIFLGILFLVISIKEKSYRKKIFEDVGKSSRRNFYHSQISRLKSSLDSKTLDSFDSVAKDFFNEFANIPESLAYEEIAAKSANPEVEQFCSSFSKLIYSGKASQNQLLALLDLFDRIIDIKEFTEKKIIEKPKLIYPIQVLEKASGFIDEARLNGFSDEQILQVFLNKGWDSKIIQKLLKGHEVDIPPIASKPILKEEKKQIPKLEAKEPEQAVQEENIDFDKYKRPINNKINK
jgi:hypothetical protein